MNILGLLIPSLLPALADGAKGLFQKFFGGTKPVSVDEQIKLMQAETEKIKAIAEIDKPADNISVWVADLRASFRYISAGCIILSTIGFTAWYFYYPTDKLDSMLEMLWQLTGSVFSFMFGDRVYLGLKKR